MELNNDKGHIDSPGVSRGIYFLAGCTNVSIVSQLANSQLASDLSLELRILATSPSEVTHVIKQMASAGSLKIMFSQWSLYFPKSFFHWPISLVLQHFARIFQNTFILQGRHTQFHLQVQIAWYILSITVQLFLARFIAHIWHVEVRDLYHVSCYCVPSWRPLAGLRNDC